ncbi:hypothetical protein BJ508DRAFT_23085 [Ascobolus immersus RN42]|uniref:Uncharacterized protein n=1 Tax=Ascobolus immersus RN42 TaxID=1160509 RepID=A0A3N4HN54_ASCIM|nr:hypothetical protein BJ508DRAFT_23085 [Ascobolus immersus RN42]
MGNLERKKDGRNALDWMNGRPPIQFHEILPHLGMTCNRRGDPVMKPSVFFEESFWLSLSGSYSNQTIRKLHAALCNGFRGPLYFQLDTGYFLMTMREEAYGWKPDDIAYQKSCLAKLFTESAMVSPRLRDALFFAALPNDNKTSKQYPTEVLLFDDLHSHSYEALERMARLWSNLGGIKSWPKAPDDGTSGVYPNANPIGQKEDVNNNHLSHLWMGLSTHWTPELRNASFHCGTESFLHLIHSSHSNNTDYYPVGRLQPNRYTGLFIRMRHDDQYPKERYTLLLYLFTELFHGSKFSQPGPSNERS